MSQDQSSQVFIISDALAGTGERVFRAAIVQFANRELEVKRVPHVRSQEQIDTLMEEVRRCREPVVLYTLVESKLRQYLQRQTEAIGVTAIDLLGPILDRLSEVLAASPSEIPGLTHRVDSNYYARVEAAEFAVRFDDGKSPKGIRGADLVLLGVSRTSKTPLSLYLANRRLKVANIPVAPELPLPERLEEQASKVVGLTIDPALLLSVRRERMKSLGMLGASTYASQDRIAAELAFAHRLFERLHCPVIDVSHQAVEETADKVLRTWKTRRSAMTGAPIPSPKEWS